MYPGGRRAKANETQGEARNLRTCGIGLGPCKGDEGATLTPWFFLVSWKRAPLLN